MCRERGKQKCNFTDFWEFLRKKETFKGIFSSEECVKYRSKKKDETIDVKKQRPPPCFKII
jgi:hypothetical protein